MKSKVLGTMLIAAFVASGASSLTSCKDTESDDIQEVDNNVAKLNAELTQKIADLQTQISNIKSCSCDQDAINTLKNDLASLKSAYGTDATWTSQIKALYDKINSLPANDTSWKAVLDELQKTTIPALQNSTKANAADIKKLSDQIDSLKAFAVDLTASLVTNAIVQATYSPGAGSLSLPLDIQSNMLITYYGENTGSSFVFPTNDASRFYSATEAESLSDADITGKGASIAAGTLLDSDGAAGNAGTLYVTVNPNTVDATGVKFSLQNSRGETSPVTLSTAAKSDDLLTWGYTRAAADNNFYAVKATIGANDIDNVKVSVNTTSLKAAVKKLLTDRNETKSSLKELARQTIKFVYDNMDTDIPRLGLTTEFGLASKTAKNVSEMNILATAVNPLGFGALDNIEDASHIPGIGTAEKKLVNFINKVKLNEFTISAADLSKVTKVNSFGKITANANGTYSLAMNVTGVDKNGNAATATTSATLTKSQLTELLGAVSENASTDLDTAIAAFNNNQVSVNNLLSEINTNLSYSIKLDNAKSSAISKMSSYLDNLNERYAYWFNRIKRSALKPCMLFEASDGAHRMTAGGVAVQGDSITLVPTTYTYELLAPAYKKFIKVYNGSDVLYAQVIPGDQRSVTVKNLKSGVTYTVVYEAVDYSGKVVARKYTVTVK